jgi:hypothetical protein
MEKIINLTLLHLCCNSGRRSWMEHIKQLKLNNPETKLKLKSVSYFNVRDLGYTKRFNFDLETLRKVSYIVNEDTNEITEIIN